MAYVNPAHKASLAAMARIEAAAFDMAPVLQILCATLTANQSMNMRDLNKCYKSLSKQVHPRLGGSFDKPAAERAMVIVARAWEQAKHSAELHAFNLAGGVWTSSYDQDFAVPWVLLYSHEDTEDETALLRAQEAAEEAAARKADAIYVTSGEEEEEEKVEEEKEEEEEEEEGGGRGGGGGRRRWRWWRRQRRRPSRRRGSSVHPCPLHPRPRGGRGKVRRLRGRRPFA